MFHPLPVSRVERLTDDSVAVTFAVPDELRETFRHRPGQHLALRRTDESGEEIRRTYSICSPAAPAGERPELRVGIRLVDGGAFSTWALKELAPGHTVDVMAPTGRFVLDPRPGHFAAVAGGSGITPVLSMAATLLDREPEARFCLIRSDRTAASTMFLDEVADLKDRHPDRFQLVTVLSREEQQAGLPSGRLDQERLADLLPALLPVGAGLRPLSPFPSARTCSILTARQTHAPDGPPGRATDSDGRTGPWTSRSPRSSRRQRKRPGPSSPTSPPTPYP
ncbi:FAD-binding oxidoreductase, partial [Streptomyces anthocyanicus]|uniref:FAD-binding oxidoreductase n=1 Tax=Streptomyces anthocyanicus TaxID=68174 RepID=UPI003665FE33